MKRVRVSPPVLWFLILCACALLFWAAPFAYDQWADQGLVLFAISAYLLLPLLSAVLPFLGGQRGLHPMAGFFPLGCALLFSAHASMPGLAFLCMGLSLVACVAGNELKKRKEQAGERKKK